MRSAVLYVMWLEQFIILMKRLVRCSTGVLKALEGTTQKSTLFLCMFSLVCCSRVLCKVAADHSSGCINTHSITLQMFSLLMR